MRIHLLAIVLLLLLSGCAQGPQAPSAGASIPVGPVVFPPEAVPAPHLGARWAYDVYVNFTEKSESRNLLARQETFVHPTIETVLDAYGRRVPGYVFEQQTRVEGAEHPLLANGTSQATVDPAVGAWISYGNITMAGPGGQPAPYLLVVTEECKDYFHLDKPLFYERPMPFTFGALWGRQLSVGLQWNESFETPNWFGTYRLSVDTKVHEQSGATFLVRQSMLIEQLDDSGQNVLLERLEEWEHIFDPDLPVPIRSETKAARSGKSTTRVLLEYEPGTEPLRFSGGPAQALWEGRNPEARVTPFGQGPDFAGLETGFPLAEAMEWIRIDPNNVQVHLWLVQHPDAYLVGALHRRSLQQAYHEWGLIFTDGETHAIAMITKQGDGPTAIKESGFGGSAPVPPALRWPRPEVAKQVVVQPIADVLALGQKFHPGLKDWGQISFGLRAAPWSTDPSTPPERYEMGVILAEQGTKFEKPVGPIFTWEKVVIDNPLMLDGSRGRVADEVLGPGYGCGRTLFVET